MSGNLTQLEKALRKVAKNSKTIKYTKGLLFTFLMTGMMAFSAEVTVKDKEIEQTKVEINDTVKELKDQFRIARIENKKLLRNANIDLIQLMEQGDQVIKSPWSSWQFGINYYLDDWNSSYKGYGDKQEKYPYEGIFVRSNDPFVRTAIVGEDDYNSLSASGDLTSATTRYRELISNLYSTSGLPAVSYGLTSTRVEYTEPVSIEVNASVSPRTITKNAPAVTVTPTIPTVTAPVTVNLGSISAPGGFVPTQILVPVAPAVPAAPIINIPGFASIVASNGNGTTNAIDLSTLSNGAIEMVAITSGNFNTKRIAINTFQYSYSNYSGINAWSIGNAVYNTPGKTGTYGSNSVWTNWSRGSSTTSTGANGFQKLVGSNLQSTMLSNATVLYTRAFEGTNDKLGEFVHLDIHGAASATSQKAGLVIATASLANKQDILAAYDDAGDNINTSTTNSNSNRYAWINSGNITVEGGNTSITNHYDHNNVTTNKSMVINTGNILFQPYYDGTNYYQKYTSVFVMSLDGNAVHHIMYNGPTGSIKTYTNVASLFLSGSSSSGRPLSIVNKGLLEMYGENSAGIYLKTGSKTDLYFLKGGQYKPIVLYGDKSIGFYGAATNSSTKGDLAIDIGASGVGNQTFTTNPGETNGILLSNYNVNPSGLSTNIEGSFGIISNAPISLSSHQIRIYDKTKGNVGIYPKSNVELNLGSGIIELNGGLTGEKNIGIYIGGLGSVKSTGSIKLDGGLGNVAIYAIGGSIPTSSIENVNINKIDSLNTKNSISIYASQGAIVKTGELNMTGATIEADASTLNQKDSGAVFATGTGTVVTLDRSSLSLTPNISITGVKLTDVDRYVGFGLFSESGAKINAKNNNIEIINGGAGVASIGSSEIDLSGALLKYKGNGYAVYTDGVGKVNLSGTKITLDGYSTAFELDLSLPPASRPITTDANTKIIVNSDNVTVFKLKNAGGLNTVNLQPSILSAMGAVSTLISPHTSLGGESNSDNYKTAVVDGGTLTIGDLDKSGVSADITGTAKGDGYFYYNRFIGQRLNSTTGSSVTISSVLSSAQANAFHDQVVGFEMNSSSSAVSNTETQINIISNSKVIADRTDSGAGAIGLFINYGTINIDASSAIEVEKVANTVNGKGVGIFAVNGSNVNNGGIVTVSGNSAFGLLGMTYRVAPTGGTAVNEFGGKLGEGTIVLNNTGTVDLSSGNDNVGVYGVNNHALPLNSNDVTITNSGIIKVGDGNTAASVGIYTNSGDITNSGNIIVGKKGAGIYTLGGNVTVSGGTISIAQESTALSMNLISTSGTSYSYNGSGGTIEVNGDKVTGYSLSGLDNMTSLSTFTDNLNIITASAPLAGEKYTQYNLSNSKFIANRSMNFIKDGFTYINAKNSAVELASGTTVSSTGLNSIGIYLDGDTLISPLTPFTGTYALKNSGTITVGDYSTGIYGKNMNTSIGNAGTITVGNNSTAAYAEDVNLKNISGGNINIGNNSTGMYQVTNSAKNTSNSGKITGLSGSNASTGIVVENTGTAPTPTAKNESTGIVLINGTNGVGMYSKGSNDSDIVNAGTVTLANGISESNPNVGIYSDNKGVVQNDNIISSSNYGIGIYATNVDNNSTGNISVGDYSIGIFSSGISGVVNHKGSITVGTGDSVGIFAMGSNKLITTDSTSSMSISNTSFGIVNLGSGNIVVSNMSTVNLSDDSIYIYSTDNTAPASGLANITNNTQINATGSRNYGIYSAGKVENYANIVMNTTGTSGNVGIYSTSGIAENYSTITVGYSDPSTNSYGIGMAATGGSKIYNKTGAVINVNGSNSIGMYGSGVGTEVYNNGTININANNAIGMYLDNGAKGYNTGLIKSTGTTGAIGIVIKNGAELYNQLGGVIDIDSSAGYAIFKDGGTLTNYGTIHISSGAVQEYTPPAPTPSLSPIRGGVQVDGDAGVITVNGVSQPITPVSYVSGGSISTLPVFTGALSVVSPLSIGMYVNTSGVQFTNPIGGISNLIGLTEAKLIYGAEAAKRTTAKYISISGDDPILKPYNDQIKANPSITWNHMSGSLTWEARADVNRTDGTIKTLYMAKLPYTMFANDTNTYNFADGLEQRYGVEALDTKENTLFQKLNGIGNNEEILLYQAYDEMMGHQYANTQQRLYSTSGLLNKEFDYLANERSTTSKQSNKIKVFGMKGEYNTDTAGIINYKNDSYGVAYVHEDETLKLGANTGWYAGVVNNTFKFKDIGGSKENTTIGKLGIFKTTTFDNNGSLKWKISGEGMLGYSDMDRRFLVVDEIFGAKSTYTSYGLALRNELSKEIRLSERTSLKPYGSIDIEYGKYGNIKEKTGEVRLEVKGNDYYSIKPELGLEYKYKQPLFVRTNLVASIGVAYENELGKVNDADNRARVAYTNADYFNLRGEKENREGNVKGDLKLGIENSKIGFTFDLGYDTEGENVRGGVGFRAIF